ncbi:MAG TPA: putative lipid II flippase FtsW [Acidimicrobiales bacterium]|nr:putative lipid II flippase FtsW [Acidimicrobiales bacterium]
MPSTIDPEAHARLVAARAATRTRHPTAHRRPPAPKTQAASNPKLRTNRAAKQREKSATSTGYLLLLALVTVLCVIGLVMVLSSSSVEALRRYGSAWLFFKRQLMWLGVGTAVLVVAARTDYRTWRRFTVPAMAASFALLTLVLVPGVGITVSGSSRWLGIGSWRIQPSEMAKLAVLLFIADLLARRGNRVDDARETLRPSLLAFGAVAFLVMLQPDMGTTLVLGCITMALLFVAGTPLRHMATLGVVSVVGAFVLGMAEPYRRARMMSFLDPWADADNTGYQVAQSIVGLADGGITGVGVGASRAKWGFLPNAHTDFIFTIIGEEMGLIGSLLVLGLFVAFAVLGVRAAVRAPDRFGMLLAAGVTAWIGGQAFINIGAVIGILPVTGVPMPFVSFGGSSLVIIMGAVGILLNIARQSRRSRPAD